MTPIEVDVTNTDPKYWEKILKKERLGKTQLGLDNDVVEPLIVEPLIVAMPEIVRKKSASNNGNFEQLRARLDKNDPFMTSGHQIKKVRYKIKTRPRDRGIPEWANNDGEVRKLIDFVFPNWRENALRRKRAARWVHIIYLFYRMQMTDSQVAAETKTNINIIEKILVRQRKAMEKLQNISDGGI